MALGPVGDAASYSGRSHSCSHSHRWGCCFAPMVMCCFVLACLDCNHGTQRHIIVVEAFVLSPMPKHRALNQHNTHAPSMMIGTATRPSSIVSIRRHAANSDESASASSSSSASSPSSLSSSSATDGHDWSVADNWDALSSENPENMVVDYDVPFSEIAKQAARRLEQDNLAAEMAMDSNSYGYSYDDSNNDGGGGGMIDNVLDSINDANITDATDTPSQQKTRNTNKSTNTAEDQEEAWVHSIVDDIHTSYAKDDPPLYGDYDVPFSEIAKQAARRLEQDNLAAEMAMDSNNYGHSYDDSSNDDGGGGGGGMIDNVDSINDANVTDAPSQQKSSKANKSTNIHTNTKDQEEAWVHSIVDDIHTSYAKDDPPLYDTGFEKHVQSRSFVDDMGKQIAMLVRCNESPESMLVEEGRALAPLTDDDLNDVTQLVECVSGRCQPTDFLVSAVSTMFHKHSTLDDATQAHVLTRTGVASWMEEALASENEGKVSSHDKRVIAAISKYGTYGSGHLLEHEFLQLYSETLLGGRELKATSMESAHNHHLRFRSKEIAAVFRDIRGHGIKTPVETERSMAESRLRQQYGAATAMESHERSNRLESMMDECEILDWDNHFEEESADVADSATNHREASGSKSSHRSVALVPNTKIPLYMKDGEFIFIDEESCIGCMKCANVAPSSFLMLESGRARTFDQRGSPDVEAAVRSCPVSCMHQVSYRELAEFESARDEGDGRTDHRHLGKAHIPLHVAMRDSDASHRSSWYHTLKHRCLMSSNCPQKGCFDCPKYSQPGDNPYWKEKNRANDHKRAQYLVESGEADFIRKFVEL
eukprot:CAMPEP_0119571278 /NCGR_PEP_ID=MMETSP1352-20130426/44035_1 /TAXON_ID=265584 /ORGANISM="Stauroneis constricta, Strain CCMP1120" /LENGTH=820 /DNA_ID=CAMNT_0007620957 /DNA_START=178 /DNA_END=2639 /DNA_ORIENTATION=-